MPTIHLTTFIGAPADIVFDLSRHIGLHTESMSRYREEVLEGPVSPFMEDQETVTWKAKHLFKNRELQVKITDMQKMKMFVDEQVSGDFKTMRHEHHFKSCDNGTILIDLFHFESPYGMLGQWFNKLYLTKYLRQLLEQRNKTIKEYAESGKWRSVLNN